MKGLLLVALSLLAASCDENNTVGDQVACWATPWAVGGRLVCCMGVDSRYDLPGSAPRHGCVPRPERSHRGCQAAAGTWRNSAVAPSRPDTSTPFQVIRRGSRSS